MLLTERLALAAAVFILGSLLSRAAYILTGRLLSRLRLGRLWRKTFTPGWDLIKILAGLVQLGVFLITLNISLGILGMNMLIISLLSTLLFISLLIGIILLLRDVWPNILLSLAFQQRHVFREGDVIILRGKAYTITDVNLFNIVVEEEPGFRLLIPYTVLLREEVQLKQQEEKTITRKP